MQWPSDSIQNFVTGGWWIPSRPQEAMASGMLLKAVVPYFNRSPNELVMEGRLDDEQHTNARYVIRALDLSREPGRARVPVAGAPLLQGERDLVLKGKKRPVLLIDFCWRTSSTRELSGSRGSMEPTYVVLPFFGVCDSEGRQRFSDEILRRVRRASYPHMMWDHLPINSTGMGSLIRFDHPIPLPRIAQAYERPGWRLSPEALQVAREWASWNQFGACPANGLLELFRDEFQPKSAQ